MSEAKGDGCGTCTLCCKIMKVDAIEKPAHQWCKHCDIGHGCRIYESRPEPCRVWSCYWLQSQANDKALAPELRPDRSHIIIDGFPGTDKIPRGIIFMVDPAYPDAWRKPAWQRRIEQTLRVGRTVVVMTGNKRKLITVEREVEL